MKYIARNSDKKIKKLTILFINGIVFFVSKKYFVNNIKVVILIHQ